MNLQRAIEIAVEAHKEDTYNGYPYIIHPLRVMFSFTTLQPYFQIVSVLHDVKEDHPDVWYQILRARFPDAIVRSLEAITKSKDELYMDYIIRVSDNMIARVVKIADLNDNLEHMDENPDKKHLQQKYLEALEYLEGEL